MFSKSHTGGGGGGGKKGGGGGGVMTQDELMKGLKLMEKEVERGTSEAKKIAERAKRGLEGGTTR